MPYARLSARRTTRATAGPRRIRVRPALSALLLSFALVATGGTVAAAAPVDAGTSGPRAAVDEGLRLSGLQVEKKTEPVGIDVDRPRFSWIIESSARGVLQESYRLRLAESEAALSAGETVWDSGVVASAESANVEYDGPALAPATRYVWSVEATTNAGAATADSEFRSGLFTDEDWQGSQWIGNERLDDPDGGEALTVEGSSWIWTPEATAPVAPAEERAFRRTLETPAGKTATSAEIVITADDLFRLFVNGDTLGETEGAVNEWQQSRRYEVELQADRNVVAVLTNNGEGSPAGLIATIRVTYSDGSADLVRTGTDWKASKVVEPGFAEPDFDDSAWGAAAVHATYGSGPWGSGVRAPVADPNPAPLLRKEFDLSAGVRQATVFVAAGGYADVTLNGEPISADVLSPGFTDFDDTAQYVATDVTSLLEAGTNAIGVELGRGFYGMTGSNVWWWESPPWHDEPVVRALLRVEFADGTVQHVVTDDSWRIADGPTVFDDLFGGETYDAGAVQPGFDTVGFDDGAWASATETTGPAGVLVNQRQQPIRITEELPAVEITEPADGTYIVKFPRVIAGWVEYTVEGPAGTTIRAQAAEKLRANGRLNADNNGGFGSGFQTDRFILAGTGEPETWEPSFSYKGFQYIEVTGWPEGDEPELADFTAKVVHTDADEWGTFESSEPIMNRVHRAVVDTLKNNIHGIPTDTPMFEKNGWTGDAAVGAEMFMMNLDTHELFAKWMRDVHESRDENGAPYVIAPSSSDWGQWGVNPIWHSAYVMIPWWLYQYGGDERVIAEQYDGMQAYVDLEFGRSANGLVTNPRLGDWVSPEASPAGGNAPEDTRVSNTAYLYEMLVSMQRTAEHLGKSDDAARFAANAETVKATFNATFLDEAAGHYRGVGDRGYRQTHNVLALAFGLTPDDQTAERVAASLVADIDAKGRKLNTGVAGTKYLLPVLSEFGYADVAFDLAVETAYPSWGYMIENGGTSMWEHWSLESRSLGHYFLGTVDDWFYHGVAGIRPSVDDGYRTIDIAPVVTDQMDWARAETQTPYGPVRVDWESRDGVLELATHVPVGSTARVTLPAENRWAATEGGLPLDEVEGVVGVEELAGELVVTVGSGDYAFEVDERAGAVGTVFAELERFAAAVQAAHDAGDLGADAYGDLLARVDEARDHVAGALNALADGEIAAAERLAAVSGTLDEIDGRLRGDDVAEPARTALAQAAQTVRDTHGVAVSALLSVGVSAEPVAAASKPGESGAVAVRVTNGGDAGLTEVAAWLADLPEGWLEASADPIVPIADELAAGADGAAELPFTVPVDTAPGSVPGAAEVGYLFAGHAIAFPTSFALTVDSPVAFTDARFDPATVEPGAATALVATIENTGTTPAAGEVAVTAPDGWVQPLPSATVVVPAGGQTEVRVPVFVPLGSPSSGARAGFDVAFVRDGATFATTRAELTVDLAPVTEVPDGYDHLDLGVPADEQAHGLTASASSGINTEAGLTRRYAGHLTDFSFFEFDMAVVAGEPFAIRAIETYDRAQTKRYKVYIDGEEAHLRQYSHTTGVGTETFEFVAPETPDASSVRVRFETQDDHSFYDPSIADVWTLPVAPDTTAPQLVLRTDPSAPDATTGWFTQAPVSVSMAARDDRDADEQVEIEYAIDGAAAQAYGSPVGFADDGDFEVVARATDRAANVSDDVRLPVRIDTVAPEATATLGDEFVDGEAIGSGTVTFQATDATSGVRSIESRVGDGAWVEGDTLTIDRPGEHRIEYRAIDVAGNVGATRSVDVTVTAPDVTAPTVSLEVSNPGTGGWHVGGATATLTATDAESGVATIEYRLDGGDWTAYTAPVALADGRHVFEYRATDVSGNVSPVGSRTIEVDATAPVVWGWLSDSGRVSVLASDAGSGIERIEYSADGATWVAGLERLVATTPAPDALLVRTIDRAGNTSAELALDRTAAPTPVDLEPGAQVLVEASGFEPGVQVRIELHSDPVLLATATASAAGVIAAYATVPAGLPAGQHTLVLVPVAADGGPGGGAVEVPANVIASTGFDAVVWIGAVIVLLLVGAAAVFFARRRRRV
ncbi:family 78 glycoside hydrolase catalytic domain [Agromyces silvae]|uniref:family 78 glycoside hydrolase catalytic domain n=1 Tax=Agromyces silvae TaxID=3388266 RepID=UPI00280C171C|nr:family 78 glycoside hydrolase catalytic domain [Agromyces protaetiae]